MLRKVEIRERYQKGWVKIVSLGIEAELKGIIES